MEQSPESTAAEFPLLATKCHLPRWHPGLVSRPRLVARLEQGPEGALSLVCAPAGFGKSTLLAEWLATKERPAAWVSLDPGDNDPALFWSYVITALQTVRPEIGVVARSLLRSPQPPPIVAILTTLINELAAIEDDVMFVLDDYHLIETQPIHDGIAFLLDHLPPRLHLVISSRQDPPLTLARLRARGQLTELRAGDLRFTPDEAASFLNGAMGLSLSAADVAALEGRTEGWIAGLQLAALSLQGRQDASSFIHAFAGDHRYIVDYLIEEVLRGQPEPVRRFLRQTAILDRLSGPLCDAVTDGAGQAESAARLEMLERGNFFVVPLDDQRHWYRYHHLFADVLQMQLLAEHPGEVTLLHRRASAWYAQHGDPSAAIRHALDAGDVEHAADLVELAAPAMHRSRQEATLLAWLKALPDDLILVRPVLGVEFVGALLANGEVEGVDARLRGAERWLTATSGTENGAQASSAAMVVRDDDAFRRLPTAIAVYRAGLALAQGDVPATLTLAQQALDRAPEADHLWRGAAAALLGLARWTSGDLEAANEAYAAGMASLLRAGNIADAIGGAIALADIRIAQGRLRQAMDVLERGLGFAAEQGEPTLRGTADMHVGISEILYERGDLPAATAYLQRSLEQGEHTGFPQHPYRWRVAMARIKAARGDLDGALALFDEAERRYVSDFYPNVRPVAAMKARLWVAQGRLGDALAWARERTLSANDDLSYVREYEHVTLARVLLAQARHDRDDRSMHEAVGLLERLLTAADAGGRTGSAIEILVLRSLAQGARGDLPGALRPLSRALTLAEPEGYARIFVDEGSPMATLLAVAAKREIAPAYVRRLLSAFGPAGDRPPANQGLIEPLSGRELDVLRLLGTDLAGPEIAEELMVSLNTMRTHTKHIYAKLGVTNRRAAVRLAEERGLLSRTRTYSPQARATHEA